VTDIKKGLITSRGKKRKRSPEGIATLVHRSLEKNNYVRRVIEKEETRGVIDRCGEKEDTKRERGKDNLGLSWTSLLHKKRKERRKKETGRNWRLARKTGFTAKMGRRRYLSLRHF